MHFYNRISAVIGITLSSISHAVVVDTTTDTADDNLCSFNEAIIVTNTNIASGDCSGTELDRIEFSTELFHQANVTDDTAVFELALSSLPISITGSLTITAPAPDTTNSVFIDQYIAAVFFTTDPAMNTAVFDIADDATLTLEGVHFDGTNAPSATLIALNSNSNLVLNDVKVSNFGNWNPEGTSTLNTLGLIHGSSAGNITITDSEFFTNRAAGNGAVLNITADTVNISNSRFEANRAVWNGTTGDGGAIAISGSTQLNIGSTIFGRNSSEGNGGAIAVLSTNAIFKTENSNFIENYSLDSGGAIYTQGTTAIYNTALLKNRADLFQGDSSVKPGAALYIDSAATVETFNSLFELNTLAVSGNSNDCFGNLSRIEYSFISSQNGCTLPANTGNSIVDASEIPPLTTITDSDNLLIGYKTNSAVLLDAGDASGCKGLDGSTLSSDINGNQRPRPFVNAVARCDIGSVEMQPLTVQITTAQNTYNLPYTGAINTPKNVTLTVKNTGTEQLKGINISFSTPSNFAVKSGNQIKSGSLQLFFDITLEPGSSKDINIAMVALADKQNAEIEFRLISEDPYMVVSPLFNDTFVTVKLSSGTPVDTTGDDKDSSGSGGGALWLLTFSIILMRRRKA